MCTSWPVTRFSCPTSVNLWTSRAPRARPWPPLPAPPTAAPPTEPAPLNRLASTFGVGWAEEWCYSASPLSVSSYLAMKSPSETGQTLAEGWMCSHVWVWKENPYLCPPTPACFHHGGSTVPGVKALDNSYSKEQRLALCRWKVGFSVWDFFFSA